LVVGDLNGEVHAAAQEPIVLLEGRTDPKRARRGLAHHCSWRPLRVVLHVAYEHKHLLHWPVDHHALLEPSHLHGSPCEAGRLDRTLAAARPGDSTRHRPGAHTYGTVTGIGPIRP